MLAFIATVVVGWLLLRLLLPRTREPACLEPPAPPPLQITIHVHRAVVVLTKADSSTRGPGQ
jgi:hypothetical protein